MSDNIVTKETVLEKLDWRYAVKKFDSSKKVSDEDFEALLDAIVLSPSSYGLQPYRFIVVTDQDLKEKLRPACYGQPQIVDSSHLVVFAAKKVLDDEFVEEYIQRLQEVRGTERATIQEYIEMIKGTMKTLRENDLEVSWSQRQAYLALGFLLETAAVMGIDACPMEGFEADKVDEILGLEDYTASALCTLGYRAEDDWLAAAEKVRFKKDTLVKRF